MQEDDKDHIRKVQLTPDLTVEIDTSPEGARRINSRLYQSTFICRVEDAVNAEAAGIDMTDIEAIYRFQFDPDRDPYQTFMSNEPAWRVWWRKAVLTSVVWMWKEMYGSYDVLYSNPNFQIDWHNARKTPCPWSEPPSC